MNVMRKREVAKQIAILLVASLAIAGWMTFFDKAFGAESTRHPHLPAHVQARCVTDVGAPCDTVAAQRVNQFNAGQLGGANGYYLPKNVRAMLNAANAKAAALGPEYGSATDAEGQLYARGQIHRLIRQAAARGVTTDPGSDPTALGTWGDATSTPALSGSCWWCAPLTNVMCIPIQMAKACGPGTIPAQNNAAYDDTMVHTSLVLLKCGGAAAIGAFGLKGGGTAWWGAGRGAAVCMWQVLFNQMFGV